MKKLIIALITGAAFTTSAYADITDAPYICTPTAGEDFDIDSNSLGGYDIKAKHSLVYMDEEHATVCDVKVGCHDFDVASSGSKYINRATKSEFLGPIASALLPLGTEEGEIGQAVAPDGAYSVIEGTCTATERMTYKQVRRLFQK